MMMGSSKLLFLKGKKQSLFATLSFTRFMTVNAFVIPHHHHHHLFTARTSNRRIFNAVPKEAKSSISSSTNTLNEIVQNKVSFDVIVVGGGHAGCEAAAAAARVGAKTCLITQRLDTIGELSCNPSMGGIGKGHLIREIDALDGLVGRVADMAGIHYRVLNRRKGPAVRGPRAQMDRDLYKQSMQHVLQNEEPYASRLTLLEASVQDLLLEESEITTTTSSNTNPSLMGQAFHPDKSLNIPSLEAKARVCGVKITTDNDDNGSDSKSEYEILGQTVILTTGTFLRGVLLLGKERYAGGRHLRDSEEVEPPSIGLAKTFERLQFPLGRLKTGTPPRLQADTIDWDACPLQPTEDPATPFSHLLQWRNQQPRNIQEGKTICCAQSHTTEKTHELVLKYQHLLPTYDGADGEGNGPRYCPSIFKKVQRFPDRTSHNCFLEPEGLNSPLVYPNGMSGPYPPEIQLEIMRSMPGLEKVEMVRPGYDVEYDFCNPHHAISHTLETKRVQNLFLAGQICGTTGYEEAAAQGIVAGANAAANSIHTAFAPFVLGRDEGYIGVLIDDLVTRGTLEPYRIFTSRAEYRISLRADNADLRLTQKGVQYGLVSPDSERIVALETKQSQMEYRTDALEAFSLSVPEWAERAKDPNLGGAKMNPNVKKTAKEVVSMPHVTLKQVEDIVLAVQKEQDEERKRQEAEAEAAAKQNDDDGSNWENYWETLKNEKDIPHLDGHSPPFVYDSLEASIKYESYAKRQHRDMDSWRRAQGARIPPDLVYDHASLPSLSNEELEKLNVQRPGTFAEASQISGMTPQSLVYLYQYVKKRHQKREQQP